jgi:predicted transcriptional regulator
MLGFDTADEQRDLQQVISKVLWNSCQRNIISVLADNEEGLSDDQIKAKLKGDYNLKLQDELKELKENKIIKSENNNHWLTPKGKKIYKKLEKILNQSPELNAKSKLQLG